MKRQLSLVLASSMVLSTVSTSTIFAAGADEINAPGAISGIYSQPSMVQTAYIQLNDIEGSSAGSQFVFTLTGADFDSTAQAAMEAVFGTTNFKTEVVGNVATVTFKADFTSQSAAAIIGADYKVPLKYKATTAGGAVTVAVQDEAGAFVGSTAALELVAPVTDLPVANSTNQVINQTSVAYSTEAGDDLFATINIYDSQHRAGSMYQLTIVNGTFDQDSSIDTPNKTYKLGAEFLMSSGTSTTATGYEGLAGQNAQYDTSISGNVATTVVERASTLTNGVAGDSGKVFSMNVPFSVTDPTQPTYVIVKSLTSPDVALNNGKQVYLTSGNLATNGITTTVTPATQANLTSTNKNGVVKFSGVEKGDIKNGVYTMTLPQGYTWNVSNIADGKHHVFTNATGTVDFDGDSSQQDNTAKVALGLSNNNRTLRFELSNYTDLTNVISGSLSITGLGVYNNTGKYDQDVDVTITGDRTNEYERTTAKIAKFGSFKVNATVLEDPTTVQSGLKNLTDYSVYKSSNRVSTNTKDVTDYTSYYSELLTAPIKISENITESFRGGDLVVTMPEGVHVSGLKPYLKDGVYYKNLVNNIYAVIDDTDAVTSGQEFQYIEFGTKNGLDTITFKDVDASTTTSKFEFYFQLELYTDIDFEGDVVPTLSSGTNVYDVVAPFEIGKVATMNSVISVDTEIKESLVGYTNQKVADIKVTEEEGDILEVGDVYTFILDDIYNDAENADYYFLNTGKISTSSDKLEVELRYNKDDRAIEVEILNNTSKDPVSFTISNIEVYSDRTVPTFNGEDEVQIRTTSEYVIQEDHHDDYIRFVNEYTQLQEGTNGFNQDVQIGLGATQATLADGTKVDLYGASYISADGNTMMPVKGTGFALGLAAEDIVYDSAAKMATFFLPGGKIAQIQANVSYATVDGVRIPLLDAKGNLVTPVIKDGRFYLPLRAAAKTVFGVETQFDAATKAVTLNPSVAK